MEKFRTSDIEGRPEKAREKLQKPSDITIVQLTPDDWRVLRDIKLRSLEAEPVAFEDQEEGLARYRTRTEAGWRDKLDWRTSSTISVFACGGEDFVGMVSAIVYEERKRALVQHMYVDADYRGRKIGKQLMEDLIGKLENRGDIEKAELTVVKDQTPARKLYESLGFVETGRHWALRGNETFMEIDMEKDLTVAKPLSWVDIEGWRERATN